MKIRIEQEPEAWDSLPMWQRAQAIRQHIKRVHANGGDITTITLSDIKHQFGGGGQKEQAYYDYMKALAYKKAADWTAGNIEEQRAPVAPLDPEEEYWRMINDDAYDYYSWWKENPLDAQAMLNGSPDAHWTDKYKTANHPSFSNESKYSRNSRVTDIPLISDNDMSKNPLAIEGGSWTQRPIEEEPAYKVTKPLIWDGAHYTQGPWTYREEMEPTWDYVLSKDQEDTNWDLAHTLKYMGTADPDSRIYYNRTNNSTGPQDYYDPLIEGVLDNNLPQSLIVNDNYQEDPIVQDFIESDIKQRYKGENGRIAAAAKTKVVPYIGSKDTMASNQPGGVYEGKQIPSQINYNLMFKRNPSTYIHEFTHDYRQSQGVGRLLPIGSEESYKNMPIYNGYSPEEEELLHKAYNMEGYPDMGYPQVREKGTTNTEIRYYLWNTLRQELGRTPTVEELNNYIDTIDEEQLWEIIGARNGYGQHMYYNRSKENTPYVRRALKEVASITPTSNPQAPLYAATGGTLIHQYDGGGDTTEDRSTYQTFTPEEVKQNEALYQKGIDYINDYQKSEGFRERWRNGMESLRTPEDTDESFAQRQMFATQWWDPRRFFLEKTAIHPLRTYQRDADGHTRIMTNDELRKWTTEPGAQEAFDRAAKDIARYQEAGYPYTNPYDKAEMRTTEDTELRGPYFNPFMSRIVVDPSVNYSTYVDQHYKSDYGTKYIRPIVSGAHEAGHYYQYDPEFIPTEWKDLLVPAQDTPTQKPSHDAKFIERQADQKAARFLNNEAGVFDSREAGQTYTKEHLDKYKQWLQSQGMGDRYLDQVGDEAFINAMNQIAFVSPTSSTDQVVAANGGKLSHKYDGESEESQQMNQDLYTAHFPLANIVVYPSQEQQQQAAVQRALTATTPNKYFHNAVDLSDEDKVRFTNRALEYTHLLQNLFLQYPHNCINTTTSWVTNGGDTLAKNSSLMNTPSAYGYTEITYDQVQPGDVMQYMKKKEPWHAGMVVEKKGQQWKIKSSDGGSNINPTRTYTTQQIGAPGEETLTHQPRFYRYNYPNTGVHFKISKRSKNN